MCVMGPFLFFFIPLLHTILLVFYFILYLFLFIYSFGYLIVWLFIFFFFLFWLSKISFNFLIDWLIYDWSSSYLIFFFTSIFIKKKKKNIANSYNYNGHHDPSFIHSFMTVCFNQTIYLIIIIIIELLQWTCDPWVTKCLIWYVWYIYMNFSPSLILFLLLFLS